MVILWSETWKDISPLNKISLVSLSYVQENTSVIVPVQFLSNLIQVSLSEFRLTEFWSQLSTLRTSLKQTLNKPSTQPDTILMTSFSRRTDLPTQQSGLHVHLLRDHSLHSTLSRSWPWWPPSWSSSSAASSWPPPRPCSTRSRTRSPTRTRTRCCSRCCCCSPASSAYFFYNEEKIKFDESKLSSYVVTWKRLCW